MELITFIQPINEGDALEYKLNNEEQSYYLTNAATHLGGIYKFRKPSKGTANDRFKIHYSGNKTVVVDVEQDLVHYVLVKEKEASEYLIQKDTFEKRFQEV